MDGKNRIFALDIGTRSVVGIILEKQDESFHVVDILSKEHTERAMLDGQIHDILAVSKVISEIKEELEKDYGPLNRVCVAAAGRSLRTERAETVVDINGKPMLTKQDILHLELSAVQSAQAIAAQKQITDNSHYYCVGYSVLYYRLDGQEIGSLIDQTGAEASVEIIATFLPKVVVESLISALHRSGLEMDALTLEPIAAINVLIPPSMRRLNVALVDIGAGTSDIAITDQGTIIAYGMVPVAGDEITEAISDQYLLDFPLAEKAKRELHTNETVLISDILGFETEVEKKEVIQQISGSLDQLAEAICNEILLLNNQKSPKAVMLVGGGSLTPDLPLRVANRLQLPANRVAVRGIDAISGLTVASHIHKGPELVTPIGIAVAAHNTPVQYVTVYVNGQPLRLFEIKQLTIGDCLLAAGIKMNKLFGKPGLAKIVSLNGKVITIPGKLGSSPLILKNGESSSLDESVKNGDHLEVTKGADGEQTELRIKDLIDHLPVKKVSLNGINYEVSPLILCNGVKATAENMVRDRDELQIKNPESISDLFEALQKGKLLEQLKSFRLSLNRKEISIPSLAGKLFLNGKEAKEQDAFRDQDEIQLTEKCRLSVKDLAAFQNIKVTETMPIFFNGEKVQLSKTIAEVIRNGQALTEDDFLIDGDEIEVIEKETSPFIFQDLFKYVDIELPEKANGHFMLLKNDNQTTFYDQLAPGDELKIVWPHLEEIK